MRICNFFPLISPTSVVYLIFYPIFFFSVCITLGFDLRSSLLLWSSPIILESKLSSRLSHENNIFLRNGRIASFKSFSGCTLYFIFSLLRFSIYNYMHFVFPERSHFSCPTSFWQVSNQYLITFSNTVVNDPLLYALLCLYTSCKMNLLMLSCLLSSSDFSNHQET